MGTLFNQSERNWCKQDLQDFLEEAVSLSKKMKVPLTEVIAAKHAIELKRQNDLYVNNGDTFDEQMMGFGELFRELIQAVKSLKTDDDY